jgi:undecaprenyl diphosphate synthase
MSGLHVGIIMDGNGRWANLRTKPRWKGHLAGVDSVRDVVRASPDLDVTTLTLYAFSSDNWKRPPAEVGRLFWLLREYCRRERAELLENGVRVSAIGRRERIPASALRALQSLEHDSRHGATLHLRLAIDYSARWLISQAATELARSVAIGALAPEEISPDLLQRRITHGVPDLDLLIRTAGEQRLSDFMLWEAAYAELYFTSTLWPDFRRADLSTAIAEFRRRVRKFGALPESQPIAKVG